MAENVLKIEYVPIDSINPYPNNAKLHPAEQIEQIKNSIEKFGFKDPIAIWKDNVIIEGHGRLIAALELGIKEVPIIRLDDLSDQDRRAYMLVHNQLTMNTGFDVDLLDIELDDIGLDMEQFGFIEEIEREIAEADEKPEVEFTEVLGEEHNYIVLYFDNDVDWLQMQSLIDIEGKMNLATRKDGNIKANMKRISVGRVFNGKEVLERLREQFENIN